MQHLDLDLELDFQQRILTGTAELSLAWSDRDAGELVVDTRALTIAGVAAVEPGGGGQPLDFELGDTDPVQGSKLSIAASNHPAKVRITYATSPDASGLQWLAPGQTAAGTAPFMFSQSEAIHARSWIPLPDNPAIRFTYTAHIRAPAGVRVIMSAINDPDRPLDGDFYFEQPHPIPSYLMAIAAGHIDALETGPRTAVYAEPPLIDKAAREFEDTEPMIETAESLYGPYPWGRYDLLVLPASFPYGGMENPNMTFATPTVLVGDKSLVSLVAHELAHSWAGNLVTAASWRDIWLNEGITTYVQGRITEAVFGENQAREETLLAIHHLEATLGEMAKNKQRLAPEAAPDNPDESLSRLPYDKGSWFMRTLEERFGRAPFDAWMKSYFAHFAWQSITTEQMLAHLTTNLIEPNPGNMRPGEIQAWLYDPGVPEGAPLPSSRAFERIDDQREAFLAGELAAERLDAGGWNTHEWMYFLDRLPEKTARARIEALAAAWPLTGTPNAEIGMRWYRRAIAAGDRSVWQAASEHMARIGRLYLTMPLYETFVKTPEGLAFAKEVYTKARAGYHPMTREAVEKLFAKAEKEPPACASPADQEPGP